MISYSDITTVRRVWVCSLGLAAAADNKNRSSSSIVHCIVNTHLIIPTQRERWSEGRYESFHLSHADVLLLLCVCGTFITASLHSAAQCYHAELMLSVLVAGCGWLFFTAAPVEQLSCMLFTDGWSPLLCSIMEDWRWCGMMLLWSGCWTLWPSPHVLRCVFNIQYLPLTRAPLNTLMTRLVWCILAGEGDWDMAMMKFTQEAL